MPIVKKQNIKCVWLQRPPLNGAPGDGTVAIQTNMAIQRVNVGRFDNKTVLLKMYFSETFNR